MMYLHDHYLVRKKKIDSFSDCLQCIANSFVEKDPPDTLLKFLSEENEWCRRYGMQMMQLLIQNQNRPAFSPYIQIPSVTPPTHGSVTSQVTFPPSILLSSSDISQHQMSSTSRNNLENQRRDTSSFKSH